jgi:hypothetical protein
VNNGAGGTRGGVGAKARYRRSGVGLEEEEEEE